MFIVTSSRTGGRSSVVRVSEFKDLGLEPLAGQSKYFLMQTSLRLTPLFMLAVRTQLCAHVKYPVFVCRERLLRDLALHAQLMKH